MNTIWLFSLFIGLSWALPRPYMKFQFRNLFVYPRDSVKQQEKSRIIGGEEVEPHSIPYQAFLEVYGKSEAWYCGGSLISANYVLTAAHCNYGARKVNIILGAHNLKKEENIYKILTASSKHIKLHEKYNSTIPTVNDIGLILLPNPVEFSDTIKIAKLPTRVDLDTTYNGLIGKVSGWGLTNSFNDVLSEVLNYVNGTILRNTECSVYFDNILEWHLCLFGDDNKSSCYGDSGGPLVVDDVQIGIASFTVMFCLSGFPSGYTRLTRYLDWIQTNSDVEII